MAEIREIVQEGTPVLREVTKEVPLESIRSPKIQKLIAEMKATASRCVDGVALAAPQIGEPLRIFVVSPRAYAEGEDLSEENLVYINPKIVKLSKKREELDEGCLSVRNVYGKIERSERATIVAYNEHGVSFERGAGGLLAEIFQHEMDHLEGKLFIDFARDLRMVPPKEVPRFVFFGTPEFAVQVAEELEKKELLPILVVAAPDKPVGRKGVITPPPMKVWAEKRHIPCIQPATLKGKEALDTLVGEQPILFVVAAYGKIIPQSILDIPSRGTLNVHPSLLPRHRGAAPIQTAILEGDKETGVCVMVLDAEMDHGPILGCERLTLGEWKPSYPELEEKLALMGGKLLARLIPKWVKATIEPKEQDHVKATFTKKLETEDAFVEPGEIESELADRKIRALHPSPGAYTILKTKTGKEVRLKLLPGGKVIPEGKKEMLFREWKRGNL
ncbi:MAG: methionyl-tRNA formyltransferase [Patescibacteria group bacterium]